MHCYFKFQIFADLYTILKSENPTLNADDIDRKVRIMRITCIASYIQLIFHCVTIGQGMG